MNKHFKSICFGSTPLIISSLVTPISSCVNMTSSQNQTKQDKQEKEYSKDFTFEKDEQNRWIIHSPYLSYWLHKIPQNTKDNIYRFNQKLNNCNVDEKLRKHGAKSKDTILIDGMEFEID